MKIRVNDYIASFLHHQNVGHVFEVAGGMITNLLDSIYNLGKTNIVSVHHEQAAAFAADAYGRCTGNVGVAFATSGPGATNLLTGVASCYFDSSPALFITGQVNTHELKGNRQIRQLGFQETDIVTMASGITKKAYAIKSADEIESVFKEAYRIAISDRPGPVLIDLPMNLQRVEIEVSPITKIEKGKIAPKSTPNWSEFFQAIQRAKRPLILAGGGINCARAQEAVRHLIHYLQVPVVTSLQALDVIPFDHPLRVGFIGSYGNRWANLAIGRCDLLVVLGSRLDIRQTGADVDAFARDKTIFHVDCDEHEINNRLKNCHPIVMDLNDFVKEALQFPYEARPNIDWEAEILQLKEKWPDIKELLEIDGVNPNQFMHQLSSHFRRVAGYVADVGNHQMWAAQSLEIQHDQFFMTSGGMGAMGFALPAAIGASLALGNKPVVVIAGDGGFQMNLQELQTIVRNKLPIKIVIINNNSLGMIRQFQDNYFDSRYQSTCWGYSAPDFEKIAHAYGLPSKTIHTINHVEPTLDWFLESDSGPALLQVIVDVKANAYPKIAFGKPITEMEPFIKPISMEAT